MSQRDEYPAGVPCFVDTGRRDADAAKGFYEDLFGWQVERVSPEGAPPYYSATRGGLTVAGMGSQPDQDWTPVWNTYVRVDDVDATAAKVTEAGGRTTMGPFDVGPAGRMAVHEDPAACRGAGPGRQPRLSVAGLVPPGDIHRVADDGDTPAVSLHVYGADLRLRGTSIRRRYDLPVLAPVRRAA